MDWNNITQKLKDLRTFGMILFMVMTSLPIISMRR
jgi:hypothetical protein